MRGAGFRADDRPDPHTACHVCDVAVVSVVRDRCRTTVSGFYKNGFDFDRAEIAMTLHTAVVVGNRVNVRWKSVTVKYRVATDRRRRIRCAPVVVAGTESVAAAAAVCLYEIDRSRCFVAPIVVRSIADVAVSSRHRWRHGVRSTQLIRSRVLDRQSSVRQKAEAVFSVVLYRGKLDPYHKQTVIIAVQEAKDLIGLLEKN